MKTIIQEWHHSLCGNHRLLLVLLPIWSICLWLSIQLHQWVNSTGKGLPAFLLQTNFWLAGVNGVHYEQKVCQGRMWFQSSHSTFEWLRSLNIYSRTCLTSFCHHKDCERQWLLNSLGSSGLWSKSAAPNSQQPTQAKSHGHRTVARNAHGDKKIAPGYRTESLEIKCLGCSYGRKDG